MPTKEEIELNKIRKLPSNKKCINCDTIAKLGHGYVCEKYKTFVCSLCKSAHQSYSMRVKSITMSNWNEKEVNQLKEMYGGGNDIARKMYFAHWTSASNNGLRKPTKDDNLEYFKHFISRIYIDREFYDSDGCGDGGDSDSDSMDSDISDSAPAQTQPKPIRKQKKNINGGIKQGGGDVIDLLGFTESTSSPNTIDNFADFSATTKGINIGNATKLPKIPPTKTGVNSTADNFAVVGNKQNTNIGDFADFTPAGKNTFSNGDSNAFDPFGTSQLTISSSIPLTSMQQKQSRASQETSGDNWDAFGAFNAAPPVVTAPTTSHDPFSIPTASGVPIINKSSSNSPFISNSVNNGLGGMNAMPSNASPCNNSARSNFVQISNGNPAFNGNSQFQRNIRSHQQTNTIGLPQSMPHGSTPNGQVNFGVAHHANNSQNYQQMSNSQMNGNVICNNKGQYHPQMVGNNFGNRNGNGNNASNRTWQSATQSNMSNYDPFAGL